MVVQLCSSGVSFFSSVSLLLLDPSPADSVQNQVLGCDLSMALGLKLDMTKPV